MSYYLSVIKDSPLAFWKMDESSGSIAYDSSGNGNNGTYVGQILKSGMPIVNGGEHVNKINSANYVEFPVLKDFSGVTGSGGLGTAYTSDNSFTVEAWIHPKTLTTLTPILADSAGIGLYWDKGNIVFKLESERVDYAVPNPYRAIHVAGVYSVHSMSLYVDGYLVKTKSVSIKFSNTSLSFASGPANSSEYFLIDSPAIYRHGLSMESIMSHYNLVSFNLEHKASTPSSGEIFTVSERYQNIKEKYIYPKQYAWSNLIPEDSNLNYNKNKDCVSLNEGYTSGEFTHSIFLNMANTYVSSQIDWVASSGVSIYVSEVSDTGPWTLCTNGSSIPGFKQGSSFSSNKILYFKFTFTSTDSLIYVPDLYSLNIYFYSEKKMYSFNGGSTLSISQPTTGTVWDIEMSNNNSSVRMRDPNNGVRPRSSAFYVNTENQIRNIEMIFTPKSLSNGYLIFNKTGSTETSLSWAAGGVITKQNISNMYINGQDVSSATNISSYLYIDEPNYILIKTTLDISGELWFNGKQLLGVRSGVLDDNSYQNIAIYSSVSIDYQDNYNLYSGKPSFTTQGSVIQVTEEPVRTYSRDRIVFEIL